LKLEQKILGKSGFETGTKTGKSNKESRDRHVVAFSLSAWAQAQLLGQFSRDWFSEHLTNSVCFLSVYLFL
jgi:hypothetical protein